MIIQVSSVSSVTRAELYDENIVTKLCSNKHFFLEMKYQFVSLYYEVDIIFMFNKHNMKVFLSKY